MLVHIFYQHNEINEQYKIQLLNYNYPKMEAGFRTTTTYLYFKKIIHGNATIDGL